MAKYIVIKDFKSPVVYSGGSHPKLRQQIKYAFFKKGRVISGTLKTKENGDPDYIIHKGAVVIPIAAVKELVTKEMVSNADGETDLIKKQVENKILGESTNKVRFIDSAIIGGVIGVGLVWYAEKKGWVKEQEDAKIPHQNKLIGLLVGGLLGAYYTHRKNIKTGIKIIKKK
jgi:hypothetical protein